MKYNDMGYPSDKSVVAGTLNNWWIQPLPSHGCVIFWGNIVSDKLGRFPDGTYIHTSAVIPKSEPYVIGDVIETRNNMYALGIKCQEISNG